MKYVINDHVVLSRATRWPGRGTASARLPRSRATLGYASSIHREVWLAAGFSHWLTQGDVALPRVDADHVLGICVIALGECGLARAMPQRSGTSWSFCAVRT